MNNQSLIANLQSPLFLQATGRKREYAVRLARAGRVRAAGNRPGRLLLAASALHDAVERGLFNGRPMFIDHPGAAAMPSLRDMAAVIVSATWNESGESADGLIRLYETPAGRLVESLLAEVLSEDGPAPDVGLSMVFWPRLEEDSETRGQGDRVLTVVEIRHVESVDFVFEPAADGRVLKRTMSSSVQEGEFVMNEIKDENGRVRDEWLDSLQRSSVAVALAQSGLPAATQTRLAAGRYDGPQQLEAAIEAARTEVAAVLENRVVQIGPHAPASRITHHASR